MYENRSKTICRISNNNQLTKKKQKWKTTKKMVATTKTNIQINEQSTWIELKKKLKMDEFILFHFFMMNCIQMTVIE